MRKAAADSRLWLALRFVHLPLNALGFAADTPDARVIQEKQRAICSSDKARDAGVTYHMDMTTARLLCDCQVQLRDPQLEQQALAQLAEQLYQFTPYIETYHCPAISQAGLLLEVSSCLQLFSGLRNLCTQLIQYLQTTAYSVELGLAHSAKAAWLLSFNHYPITGEENKALFCQRLKILPTQFLHDFPKAVAGLEKTGFTTLGDIARQIEAHSSSSIKKRFGAEFADAIGDIFALDSQFQQSSLFSKPATLYRPPEFFIETLQFDYPINQIEQLQVPMTSLLEKLSAYLRQRQYECQQIEWTLCDIYRNSENLRVYSDSAQSTGALLYQLSHIQLQQRQLPFAVDTLELRCNQARPVQNRSQALDFNQTYRADRRSHNFATTAAKLKARLGDAAIFKLSYCDSHFPESSNAAIALSETCNQQLPAVHSAALRPAWLFATPVAIEQRPQGLYWRGYLRLTLGPERIQGNWWNVPCARDYFLAQRHDHVRLWIFLDLHRQHWFVHGIFG